MKKLILVHALALVGTLGLTACPSNSSSPSPQSTVNNCLMDPTHCGTASAVASGQVPNGNNGSTNTSTTGVTTNPITPVGNGNQIAGGQIPTGTAVTSMKLALTAPAATPPDHVVMQANTTGAPIEAASASSAGGDSSGGGGNGAAAR